jgi:hypothetical protein
MPFGLAADFATGFPIHIFILPGFIGIGFFIGVS